MTTPLYSQDAYLGRNDDGSESTATNKYYDYLDGWKQETDTNFRVRFGIRNTNNTNGTCRWRLQYSTNGTNYYDVTASSSVVRASDSSYLTDGTSTTQQITFGAFVATNYGVEDGDGYTNSYTHTKNYSVEVEFCVQIRGADVNNGDEVYLRCELNDTTAITWANIPRIVVSKTLEGTGVLAGNAQVIPAAPANMLSGLTEVTGFSAVLGSGTVEGTGGQEISAAGELAGTSTVIAQGLVIAASSGVITGDAQIAGTGTLIIASPGTLAGSNISLATAAVLVMASGVAQGAAQIISAASVIAGGSASVTGGGQITGIASRLAGGSAPGAGVGQSTGIGGAVPGGVAMIAAASTVTGILEGISPPEEGAVTVAGTSAVLAVGTLYSGGAGMVTGASAMVGTGGLLAAVTSAIVSATAVTGAGRAVLSGLTPGAGAGEIIAVGAIASGGVVVIAGASAVTGIPEGISPPEEGAVTIAGGSTVLGTGIILMVGAGVLAGMTAVTGYSSMMTGDYGVVLGAARTSATGAIDLAGKATIDAATFVYGRDTCVAAGEVILGGTSAVTGWIEVSLIYQTDWFSRIIYASPQMTVAAKSEIRMSGSAELPAEFSAAEIRELLIAENRIERPDREK